MSLPWTIDSQERLFTAVAEGNVSRSDIEVCLDAMTGSGAMAYRKLFDGTRGDTLMTVDELLEVGVRMRAFHAQGPMGPLAVVVPREKCEMVTRILGILAAADRPMRLFSTVRPARRWLESVKPPG